MGMLGMLMGAQAETMIKATFAGWSEYVVHTKMERLKEQSMKMRTKEDESRRRMLLMLAGSQGNLLVKTTFSAWSECVHQARQQREVEQMSKSMRTRGDESTKRMLGMLMGAQTETLIKAV